jgi:hypothetical protein
MKKLKIKTNNNASEVFDKYPFVVREKLQQLRKIIIETADEIPEIEEIDETLKWGEPSYLTKYGSTIRIDWKEKTPDQYAMYFKCTSKLVPTFRELFSEEFNFEKDRAIIFDMNENIHIEKLKKCIESALMYHKVKNKPLLGIKV